MMQEFLLVVKMALRLTRLTKYTCGEARELVIDFLHDRPDVGYTNAMNLLEKQYGDPHRLLASYRREIKQMSKIKSGDAVAFRRLFNFLIKCQTMSYSTSKNPLDSPDVICMILSKVPGHLQERWNRNALRIRRTETREPELLDLTNFIEDEMILVNDPLFSREAVGQYDEKPPRPQKFQKHQKIHTYAITKDAVDEREVTQAKTGNCPVCEKGHHDIEDCPTFLTQPVQDRSKTVFKKKLCYGCLAAISKEHNAKKCSNRRSCKVCNGRHTTTLRGLKLDKKDKASIKDKKSNGKQNEKMKCASINTYSDVVSMCIVPVKVKRKDSINEVQRYALLDSCNQGTFILDKLAKAVGTSGRKTSITIKTINEEHTSSSMTIKDLQVANVNNVEGGWIDLPNIYTKPALPVDNKDITQPSQLKQWKYLEHITNQFNLEDNLPVGLLIRANYVKAIEPLEILQSRNEGPYAFKTRFGWCIFGPVSQNTVSCNRIAVRRADTKQVGTHFFQVKNKVHNNEVPNMLKNIYNHDFTDSHHMLNKKMVGASQEDKSFLKILK